MGDYVKKPSQQVVHPRDKDLQLLLQRLVRNTTPNPQPVQQVIDTAEMANVIAQAVGHVVENNLKNAQTPVYNLGNGSNESDSTKGTYDESKSLAKLAESMLVQRGNNKSNFDDLGGVNISKKDSKETQSTIDLLKNLND